MPGLLRQEGLDQGPDGQLWSHRQRPRAEVHSGPDQLLRTHLPSGFLPGCESSPGNLES